MLRPKIVVLVVSAWTTIVLASATVTATMATKKVKAYHKRLTSGTETRLPRILPCQSPLPRASALRWSFCSKSEQRKRETETERDSMEYSWRKNEKRRAIDVERRADLNLRWWNIFTVAGRSIQRLVPAKHPRDSGRRIQLTAIEQTTRMVFNPPPAPIIFDRYRYHSRRNGLRALQRHCGRREGVKKSTATPVLSTSLTDLKQIF